jgi:hypothetical protein
MGRDPASRVSGLCAVLAAEIMTLEPRYMNAKARDVLA